MKNCKDCGRDKKIKARGLCSFCYAKNSASVAECKRCGKVRRIKSKDLCAPCSETVRIQSSSEKTKRKQQYLKQYKLRPDFKQRQLERSRRRASQPGYKEKVERSAFLRRLSKYGINEEIYNDRISKGCEICGEMNNLHIDHCHQTGLFRGILCGRCNTGIGMFKDSADELVNAAYYLQEKDYTGLNTPVWTNKLRDEAQLI